MEDNPRLGRIVQEKSWLGQPRFRMYYNEIKPSGRGPDANTGALAGGLVAAVLYFFKYLEPVTQNIVKTFSAAPNTWFNTALTFGVPMVAFTALPMVGRYIGGYFNKREEERWKTKGRVINRPSRFNRELVRGAVQWASMSQLVALGVGAAIGAFTGVGASAFLTTPAFYSIAAGIGALSGIIGAVRGSKAGMERMEDDYKEVSTLYTVQTGELVREQERGLDLTIPALGAGAAIAAGVATGVLDTETASKTAEPLTAYAYQGDPNSHPAAGKPDNYFADKYQAQQRATRSPQVGQAPARPPAPTFSAKLLQTRIDTALKTLHAERT